MYLFVFERMCWRAVLQHAELPAAGDNACKFTRGSHGCRPMSAADTSAGDRAGAERISSRVAASRGSFCSSLRLPKCGLLAEASVAAVGDAVRAGVQRSSFGRAACGSYDGASAIQKPRPRHRTRVRDTEPASATLNPRPRHRTCVRATEPASAPQNLRPRHRTCALETEPASSKRKPHLPHCTLDADARACLPPA